MRPLQHAIAAFQLAIIVSLIPCSPAAAESQWSRFHGESGQGYVAEGQLPATWKESDYTWTRKLGSRDISSPIIADDQVFLLVSYPQKGEIAVESLDVATGKLLWSKSFDQTPHHLHQRNTLASSTPVADDNYVFAAWSDPDHTMLKCFNHEGAEIWSRDFGSWQSQHGFGTSPTIIGDMVVLMNSQQAEQLQPGQKPGQSRMIAVDRTSGETIWESALNTTRSCYGVPAISRDVSGKIQHIVGANTGNGLFGLDPTSGKMMWSMKVFDERCCSTPIVAGDIAIGTSGSGGGGGNQLVAIRMPADAGGEPQELYRIQRNAPYVPTPVLKDGRLFMIDDRGIAQCADVQTGDVLWFKRIGGNFGASPIIVGDTMLVVSLDGKATTIEASDEFKKLGEVDLGGPVGATPAYADGRLLIRVDDELRCLGGKTL